MATWNVPKDFQFESKKLTLNRDVANLTIFSKPTEFFFIYLLETNYLVRF